jgi:hypothetical protein
MGKKLGKLLFFTAAAAAAYGTYQYYKKNKAEKEHTSNSDVEDFYDFDHIDDETFDKSDVSERSYISLDKKIDLSAAKETARGVVDTVMDKVSDVAGKVADVAKSGLHNAEQAVNHMKKSEPAQEATDFVETNILNDDEPIQKTEEFFDDEKGEMKEGWENL